MLSLFKRVKADALPPVADARADHSGKGARCDTDASHRSFDTSAHSSAPTRRNSNRTGSPPSSNAAPLSPEGSTPSEPESGVEALDDMPHLRPIEQGGLTLSELAEAMIKDAKDQEHIVPMVSRMLAITVERNDRLGRRSNLESFEGEKAPVTITQYINRIVKYGGCSSCVFVVGLMYLNRLKRLDASVRITSCNFQRLFLVAVMEAAKYLDDHYYSNKHWAQIGGLTTAEINDLELEMVFRLAFNVTVSREEYDEFLAQISEADSQASASARQRPAERTRARAQESPATESKAGLSPNATKAFLSGRSTPKRSPTVGADP